MVWSQNTAANRMWVLTSGSRSCLRSTKPNENPSHNPNVSTHIRIAALLWDIQYSTLNTQHSILDTQYSTLITQYLIVNTQYSNTQYSLFLGVINNTKGEFAIIPITTLTALAYFTICHCTEYLFFCFWYTWIEEHVGMASNTLCIFKKPLEYYKKLFWSV